MARAFFQKRNKKVCSNVPCAFFCVLFSHVSAYDCLKIAADGPSVFHSPNTPLFSNPPRFSVIMFSLFSPLPPTFYYSFFFSNWTPATLETRAKTYKGSYSNRCFLRGIHEPRLVLFFFLDLISAFTCAFVCLVF